MYQLILIRHGQSEWNKAKLFTGWHDAELSDQGRNEAIEAGKKIKSLGLNFTFAYTSMLKRAIGTLWLTLKHCDQMNIPVEKSWRLNERHYGALQGQNKDEARQKHGDEQVHIWRRSYDTPPPQSDLKPVPLLYKGLEKYPQGESLKMTYDRVVPYWNSDIKKRVLDGEKIIISAHGNSLRALIKHLENITDEEIVELEIPTGKPIKIELDKDLKFLKREYL